MRSGRIAASAAAVAVLAFAGAGVAANHRDQPALCHYGARGGPDGRCTPGATVPVPVSRLCRSGYATHVRPSRSESHGLKAQVVGRYHVHGFAAYEMDHLIPLELGGAPRDLRNLWPEPWADARAKDVQENDLHREVCSGTMSLSQAQRTMRRWDQ